MTIDALSDPQVRVVERALMASGVVIGRWEKAESIVRALRESGDLREREAEDR